METKIKSEMPVNALNESALAPWEPLFEAKIKVLTEGQDPAHDLLHFKRVVRAAKQLTFEEKANPFVTVPAAWLHDFVLIPKDSPLRSQASRMAAEAASTWLIEIGYPNQFIADIRHAIEGHSFTAQIEVKTLEAQIVQDADRLDGLGAIGIARCFATAGLLKSGFYSELDPFCENRSPDDKVFAVDHFYKKLFKIAETLNTKSGRKEGLRRAEIMKKFLSDLSSEIHC